jgi:uncharacterized protein YxeA
MKKIIIIFVSLFLAFACSPKIMMNSIKGTYNIHQVDSICNVERLPDDLTEWHGTTLYDYETNERINQYVFIKEYNRKNEVIYTITVDDSTYYFTKRVVEKIQK